MLQRHPPLGGGFGGAGATKIGEHDLVGEVERVQEPGVEKRVEGDYVWLELAY